MLDWLMASTRPHFAPQSLSQIDSNRDRCRVWPSRPITSMGNQPIVQDNESTDPALSRDGKT